MRIGQIWDAMGFYGRQWIVKDIQGQFVSMLWVSAAQKLGFQARVHARPWAPMAAAHASGRRSNAHRADTPVNRSETVVAYLQSSTFCSRAELELSSMASATNFAETFVCQSEGRSVAAPTTRPEGSPPRHQIRHARANAIASTIAALILSFKVLGAIALNAALPGSAEAGGRTLGATQSAIPDHGFHLTVKGPNQPAVRLYGEAYGAKRAPTVVLLHGLGASSYSWRLVIRRLAKHRRVIALDLRGHGRSEKPFDQHYEHRAQAELVRDAIRKLRLRKVTLVGHSYGGAVALVAALQANARRERQIRRLVVLNAPVYPQKLSFAVRFLQKPVVPYVALSVVPPHVPVSLALMAEAIGMPHITETDIDVYARPFFDAGANHALIVTARNIVPRNAQDLIAHYPTIRQPTLVIWCRKDQVVPLASGQRLVKDLPRAQLEVLDRCDHASPEQRPKSIARLIRRFSRR